MTTTHDALTRIRRPRLLIRAARFGVEDYQRSRDLKRILRSDVLPGPGRAVDLLVDLEAHHDAARRAGAATYSIATHLDVLIALMAEARHLEAATAAAPAAFCRSARMSLAAR